jgi:hypothetical protein
MLNGEHDFFFPVKTSQRPRCELLGTPAEHKNWLVYPGGARGGAPATRLDSNPRPRSGDREGRNPFEVERRSR